MVNGDEPPDMTEKMDVEINARDTAPKSRGSRKSEATVSQQNDCAELRMSFGIHAVVSLLHSGTTETHIDGLERSTR